MSNPKQEVILPFDVLISKIKFLVQQFICCTLASFQNDTPFRNSLSQNQILRSKGSKLIALKILPRPVAFKVITIKSHFQSKKDKSSRAEKARNHFFFF